MRQFATRTVLRALVFVLAAGCAVSLAQEARSQTLKTLKAVKERGSVACGVSQGVIGFSALSAEKHWTGIDVDFCRALAAAIFDDPSKVDFLPLSADDRFQALQSKKIDILSRNSTWTMARETEFGLLFAG